MMVEPEQRVRVRKAWAKFQDLQDKMDAGTLGQNDMNIFEFLKVEIALIQADAMVTIAARQQGPW